MPAAAGVSNEVLLNIERDAIKTILQFFGQRPQNIYKSKSLENGKMQPRTAGSELAAPEVVSLKEIQRCVEGRQEQLEQVLREAFVAYTGNTLTTHTSRVHTIMQPSQYS